MTAEQEAEIGRRMAEQAAKDMAAWRAHHKREGLLLGQLEASDLKTKMGRPKPTHSLSAREW